MTRAKDTPRASTIRPLRQRPSSVPVSHELYSQTADPTVVAFQVTAMFHNPTTDPPLTLDALRARWKVGRPKATIARRTLIDLGFWIEVRAKDERGQYFTETLTWDQQITLEDLQDLALHYRPGSKLDCGGCVYRVDACGQLDIDAGGADRQKTVTRADQVKFDVGAGGADRQKTDTRAASGPDPQKTDTRADQGSRQPDPQKTDTRANQAQQDDEAGQSDRQKTATHASPLRGDEEEHACMSEVLLEEFWARVAANAAAVGRGGQRSVHRQVLTAFAAGWTPRLLADWVIGMLQEMRKRKPVRNPAGFVVSQLRDIPPLDDATEPVGRPVGDGERLPACNTCGARAGENLSYRTVDSPDGGVRKCPDCHPAAAGTAAA